MVITGGYILFELLFNQCKLQQRNFYVMLCYAMLFYVMLCYEIIVWGIIH